MGHRVAVLRDGRLQQVDTPGAALRPPGQHLRRGLHRVAGDHARRVRRPRGRRRACTASTCRSTARWPAGRGRRSSSGLRPESWHVVETPERGPDATSLALNVELVESLGVGVVRLRPSRSTPTRTADRVTVRLDKRTHLRVGDVVHVEPNRGEVHLFDAGVGRADRGLRCPRRPGPWASGRFDVEGHRGARGLVVENTLASFAAAYDAGVTGVELDVRLTADGEVVVWHDAVLLPQKCRSDRPRPRRGPGRRPDAGAAAHRRRRQPDPARASPDQRPAPGARISTLGEVLATGSSVRPDVWWTIELKIDPRDAGGGRRAGVGCSRGVLASVARGGARAASASCTPSTGRCSSSRRDLAPAVARSALVEAGVTWVPGSPWTGSVGWGSPTRRVRRAPPPSAPR